MVTTISELPGSTAGIFEKQIATKKHKEHTKKENLILCVPCVLLWLFFFFPCSFSAIFSQSHETDTLNRR